MEGADGAGTTPAPRSRVLLGLVLLAVAVVSVLAVLVVGGLVGDHLEEDDPSSVSVQVTGTPTTSTTSASEPVVLAPPVSINSTTTAPDG